MMNVTKHDKELAIQEYFDLFLYVKSERDKLPVESINSLGDENIENIITTFLKDPKLFLVLDKLEEQQHLKEDELKNKKQDKHKQHKEEEIELDKRMENEIQTKKYTNLVYMDMKKQQEFDEFDLRWEKKFLDVDQNILNELLEQIKIQQTQLVQAAVPGFKVTTDPKDVRSQISLLSLLKKLSVRYRESYESEDGSD